jgi:hypothetical protein
MNYTRVIIKGIIIVGLLVLGVSPALDLIDVHTVSSVIYGSLLLALNLTVIMLVAATE